MKTRLASPRPAPAVSRKPSLSWRRPNRAIGNTGLAAFRSTRTSTSQAATETASHGHTSRLIRLVQKLAVSIAPRP